MSNLIIDAPLLACPNPESYTEEVFQEIFLNYLQGITDVSNLRANFRSIKVWRDSQLAATLHAENYYPFRHTLVSAFERLGDDNDFQLQDINLLAMSLLEKTSCFEEEGDIVDVAVNECEVLVDVISTRTRATTYHLCRQLCLALSMLGDGRELKKNTYLASRFSTGNPTSVKVKYQLEMTEYVDGTYTDANSEVALEIESYRNAGALLNECDLKDWWSSGYDFAEMDSVCIGANREAAKPIEEIANFRSRFSFGTELLNTAAQHGFLHDPSKVDKLLRVCMDLAADRNLVHTHALRTGKGGNDPQKSRGEWKAWRIDIDYEYHLHYWKKGSNIELSNIVVHNDFSIYQ